MKGHLKDRCFKLIGYPDWYKGKTGSNSTSGFRNATPICNKCQGVSFGFSIQDSSLSIEDNNAALYKEFLKFMNSFPSFKSPSNSHSVINFAGTYLSSMLIVPNFLLITMFRSLTLEPVII